MFYDTKESGGPIFRAASSLEFQADWPENAVIKPAPVAG